MQLRRSVTRHAADRSRLDMIRLHRHPSGDETHGEWRLTSGRALRRASADTATTPPDQSARRVHPTARPPKTEAVRISGTLTTNDGEIAVKRAPEGHGILTRAEWDLTQCLADGSLVLVLPDHDTPNADIFAVYSQQQMSNRSVRSLTS